MSTYICYPNKKYITFIEFNPSINIDSQGRFQKCLRGDREREKERERIRKGRDVEGEVKLVFTLLSILGKKGGAF